MSEPVIMHRGFQVPWVIRWTSERRQEGYRGTPVGVVYPHETPEDRVLDGYLWQREGDSRGVGEPEWTEVHSHRQLECMIGPRCQVCGRLIEGKVTWLHPIWSLRAETKKGRITTATPPTCRDCIPVAQSMCPHLQARGSTALEVTGYRPHAIFGEVWDGRQRFLGELPLERGLWVLGKQLVVEIYDFRKVRI
jgi:hypothetical protein